MGKMLEQHHEFLRGIDAVDVARRIGFGVAEPLRLGQGLIDPASPVARLRQDVVARAIDDADQAFHVGRVGASCEDAEKRHAGDDRCFVQQGSRRSRGGLTQFHAVRRQQRLVRSNDRNTPVQRLQHEGTCRLDPAEKLHEDVGRRGEERAGIYYAPGGRGQRRSRPERVAYEGVRYPERGL